jgi:RNA polymerase sigma-B factor
LAVPPVDERRKPTRAHTKRAVDERRLVIRYREHGDLAARDELTRRLMPLARQLARRYASRSEPLEDLMQVANLGLVKAVDRFDPDRGTALSTYAVPTILGELRRYFRDTSWSVHVERSMQERAQRVERESNALAARLGRSPSVREIAGEIDLTDEEIVEALQASSASRAMSLDEKLWDDEGSEATLADTLGHDEGRFELVEDLACMEGGIRRLDDRARVMLSMRFEKDMTQSEIAAAFGISQMHVSRLLRAALATLRESADEQLAA